MPLPLVVAANAAVGKRWAHHAIAILAGFTAGGAFLFGAFDLTAPGSAVGNPMGVDIGIMVTGVVAATMAAKPVRERLARFLPVDADNPVHSYALVLAVILLGAQVSSLAFSNVFATVNSLPPLTIGDLAANEAPYLIMAYAGVGIWMRRSLAESSDRLGLVAPAWWHITLALGAAGAFWGIGLGADWLSHVLTPGLASQVDRSNAHEYGGLFGAPGILAIGLLPGICEDLLFRGALQPRFGLIATAVLFAALHINYGVTIDLVAILVLAIGLGLIRKYLNTTASMTCHTTYNLLVGLAFAGTYRMGVFALAAVLLAVSLVQLRLRPQSQPESVEEEAVR
ncbi:MAG TPA: type II CAAX endopeptidase family protein [Candidatus Dormibacteraeota bacterium]|nr:type II CAAX endopeptidase family protein [Candidatus Dormibacteraeota bacterium]